MLAIAFKILKPLSLPSLLLFLSTLLFAACSIQTHHTQQVAFSGFGGTGHSTQGDKGSDKSGFGGTGHRGFGGTGIIGTISAFGSIWVNGIEVKYTPETPIQNPLGEKTPLKLGQQVIVETQSGTEKPLAKQIQVFIPIAGKIQHRQGNQITIKNQIVTLKGGTLLDKKVDLTPGHYVAINGYQIAANQWIATRINRNPLHKNWFKPKIPLHFDRPVQKIILQPELIDMVKNLQNIQQLKSEMQEQSARLHQQAIMLRGQWQNERFKPDKLEWMDSRPKITPSPAIQRPHPMREQSQQLKEQNQLMENMKEMREERQEFENMQEMREQHQELNNLQDKREHAQQMKEMSEQMQEMHQESQEQMHHPED